MWFIMCSVFDIDRKLVCVLSDIVYIIECMIMKIRLLLFKLNYMSVMGSRVIVGSGLNMVVSVFRKFCLSWLLMFSIINVYDRVRLSV